MSSRDDATRHESSPEGSKVMNTCSMRLWKVQLRYQERSRPSVHRCSLQSAVRWRIGIWLPAIM